MFETKKIKKIILLYSMCLVFLFIGKVFSIQAAGVILLAKSRADGKMYTLLGNRDDNRGYCTMGGKLKEEENPRSAAVRETEEETSGKYKKEEIEKLIPANDQGLCVDKFTYYVAKVPEMYEIGKNNEYLGYHWVLVSDLVKNIRSKLEDFKKIQGKEIHWDPNKKRWIGELGDDLRTFCVRNNKGENVEIKLMNSFLKTLVYDYDKEGEFGTSADTLEKLFREEEDDDELIKSKPDTPGDVLKEEDEFDKDKLIPFSFLANMIRSTSGVSESKAVYVNLNKSGDIEKKSKALWVRVIYDNNKYRGGYGSSEDYESNGIGGMIGYNWSSEVVIGGPYIKIGGQRMVQNESKANARSIAVGLCGGYIEERLEIKAILRAGLDYYDGVRIKRESFVVKEEGEFDGYGLAGDIEGTYKIMKGESVGINPYIGLEGSTSEHKEDKKIYMKNGSYSRVVRRAGIRLEIKGDLCKFLLGTGYKRVLAGETPTVRLGGDKLFGSKDIKR
ncbi:MAG: autotransporter domain-containing protein [Endomicrobium sp.]|jgi:8-oxo-dGTP pyrophosphatase MutT (NUDIX family)|nr:autotransporter domain-containing protein [Endomicrobium sp.]